MMAAAWLGLYRLAGGFSCKPPAGPEAVTAARGKQMTSPMRISVFALALLTLSNNCIGTFTLSAILLHESFRFTVYVLTQPVATLAPTGDGALKTRAPVIIATTRSLRGKLMAERVGFEPTVRFKTDNALAGRPIRPLWHLSWEKLSVPPTWESETSGSDKPIRARRVPAEPPYVTALLNHIPP